LQDEGNTAKHRALSRAAVERRPDRVEMPGNAASGSAFPRVTPRSAGHVQLRAARRKTVRRCPIDEPTASDRSMCVLLYSPTGVARDLDPLAPCAARFINY
jgi:hypothetical protein